MSRWRAIVFDLDDTLYLEREYVRSGFLHVTRTLDRAGEASEEEIFAFLWNMFEKGLRGNLFDCLLKAYPKLGSEVSIEELVKIYRNHTPTISPLEGAIRTVNDLRSKGCLLAILSDGPLASQRAKVRALGLGEFFRPVILTDVWGPSFWKPHPRGYEVIAEWWGLEHQELLYVGDDPEKDFVTPKRLGWYTIRLRVKGQLRFMKKAASTEYRANTEVSSYRELRHALDAL